jgi:hypothetical protein
MRSHGYDLCYVLAATDGKEEGDPPIPRLAKGLSRMKEFLAETKRDREMVAQGCEAGLADGYREAEKSDVEGES